MTGMSLLVAVAVALASVSSTIVAGGDCPGAHRTMTMEAACREATAGKPISMYKLCMGTLGRGTPAGPIHEASEYAFIAAWETTLEYQSAIPGVKGALNNASITGEEKATYELCDRGYDEANAAMERTWKRLERVSNRLPERACGLDLGDEYRAALRGLGACRDRAAKLPDSQLLGIVEVDYNGTMVAYLLGKLIGIK